MNTVMYMSADGKDLLPGMDWELTGDWAYFKDSDSLSIQLEFVGKTQWYKKWFNKIPQKIWVDETRVKLVYWNQVNEDEE